MPRSGLLLLAVAALAAAACDSPSGADGRACGGGTIDLQVGEAADLVEGADCDLGNRAGAEYALAYVDGRAIAQAESGPETYTADGSYTTTVTGLLGDAAAAQSRGPARARASTAPAEADWVVLPSGGPRAYLGASGGEDGWSVGELVTITDPCTVAASCGQLPVRLARVHRVYHGWLVVAAVEGEVGAALAPMLELLDQAAPIVNQHTLPLLRSAFTDGAFAVSSPGTGQMFVLLEGDNSTYAARAFSLLTQGGQPVSWISMEPFTERDVARTASLVSHELTHAYQFAYMVATRSAGVQNVSLGAGVWGVEGGANLVSYESTRRAAGVPLAGNYDFRNPGGGVMERYYAFRAQPGNGEVTAGYDSGMGFFRDLVIRRVQRGEAVDAAVREVSRGVVEGWYGIDRYGSRRPGLTARMRERIAGWEARDALLTWALSHAGDDLTSSAVYQDAASLRAWESAEPEYGWFPEAVLEGSGTVNGQTLNGSPGYFIIRNTGAGVKVRVSASVPGVQWRVLRIR